MNKRWNPDSDVLGFLKEEVEKRGGSLAILVGSKGATAVADLLQEVKEGTENGRKVHKDLLKNKSIVERKRRRQRKSK